MIKITIDDKPLESVLEAKDREIQVLNDKINVLEEMISSLRESNQIQSKALTDLQNDIIEMQTEETKERRSLWDFLTGRNKPEEPKPSRIKESTVVLDK